MAFSLKLRRQLTNSSIKSIPEESVEYYTLVEVQNRLTKLYEEDNDIFEESDMKKIVESFGYLKRFAQRQDGNADKTFEMVKRTLIWRKGLKVSLITDEMFPLEFYEFGAVFINGTDFDGNGILNCRAKYAYFNPKVKNAIERWFAYLLFKVVEMSISNGKGWVLLVDLTGISLAQYDLPEIIWAIKVIINYMPAGLKKMIMCNVPWFAKAPIKIVMTFIPREWKEIVHFVNHKELHKFIPKEHIPPYIENPKVPFSAPPLPGSKRMSEIDISPLETDKDELMNFIHNLKLNSK